MSTTQTQVRSTGEALKALVHEMEYVLSCINADKVPFDGDDFHEALRLGKEALAQPEQEPYAWEFAGTIFHDHKEVFDWYERGDISDIPPLALYTTPPTQQSCSKRQCNAVSMKHIKPLIVEQRNEMHTQSEALKILDDMEIDSDQGNWPGKQTKEALRRLAAIEQQRTWVDATTWRGLTDEERGQAINVNFGTGLWAMAKDIEAKLKAKNEQLEKNT